MPPVPAFVRESHQAYHRQPAQEKPSILPLLARLGHPQFHFCETMQRFFDQLAYDARSGLRHSRFYSALDEHNYSLVSPPAIYEVDTRRNMPILQLIGRASRNMTRYALFPGEVDFFTSDQALLNKVAVRLHARTYPCTSDDQVFFMASKPICNADDLRVTREVINLYHAGHILPFARPTSNDSTLISKELLQATQAAAAAPDAWL